MFISLITKLLKGAAEVFTVVCIYAYFPFNLTRGMMVVVRTLGSYAPSVKVAEAWFLLLVNHLVCVKSVLNWNQKWTASKS